MSEEKSIWEILCELSLPAASGSIFGLLIFLLCYSYLRIFFENFENRPNHEKSSKNTPKNDVFSRNLMLILITLNYHVLAYPAALKKAAPIVDIFLD